MNEKMDPESSGEYLPPVTPPTATFILQLFLIPLLIVGIIVSVWLMFSWVAQIGSDPTDLVRDLQTLNKDSWRKAYTLSNLLKENDELKRDAKLCQQLSDVLEEELQQDTKDNQRIYLRVYLCRTLGEFHVPEGLPVLMKVARNKEAASWDPRLAALDALSVLAESLKTTDSPAVEEQGVVPMLISISRETSGTLPLQDVDKLREVSAFVLGVIGGDEAQDRLAQMLKLAKANTRYNAATGLSRHGDWRCVSVVLEMLDPDNEQAFTPEQSASEKQLQRDLVMINGVRAVSRLARGDQAQDTAEFLAALKAIDDSTASASVKTQAREAVILLGQAAQPQP